MLRSYMLDSINLGIYFLFGACFYLYKEIIPLKLYIWFILFAGWLVTHIWFWPIVRLTEQPFLVYSFMWIAFRWYKIPFIKADISYGLYLYAIPVQIAIQHVIGQSLNFVTFLLLTMLVTTAIALLSWYLVEKKALSLKHMAKKKETANTI